MRRIRLAQGHHVGLPAFGSAPSRNGESDGALESARRLRAADPDCSLGEASAKGAPPDIPARDDDQERKADSCFLAKEQPWRTAWRARSLLSWTTTSRRRVGPGAIAIASKEQRGDVRSGSSSRCR